MWLVSLASLAACNSGVDARDVTADGGQGSLDGGGLDGSVTDAAAVHDAGSDSPHAPPTPAAIQYFSDISDSLLDADLVNALHQKLLADHDALTYSELLDAYIVTDGNRNGCDGIFDFYSTKCWQRAESCGPTIEGEGDCFNREHSWPKSWWGGQRGPDQHHDLILVVPSDGFVNGIRGRLPYGEVTVADFTSTNGSRRGDCETPGNPGGTCFEPPDDLKGDFARIYFYVAVRYEGEFNCCAEASVEDADIRLWQEDMLKRWHEADPVDIAERDRNERVFGLQRNRNPFVDFPSYVGRITDF